MEIKSGYMDQSKEFVASEIFLGEFKLPRSLVDKINKSSILPVADQANIEDIPDADFQGPADCENRA